MIRQQDILRKKDITISGSTSVTYDKLIQEKLLKDCEECTCTGKVDFYRQSDNSYKFNYNLSCDIGKDNPKHFEEVKRNVEYALWIRRGYLWRRYILV